MVTSSLPHTTLLHYPIFFVLISDGFDIVVNDCFAHNGATKKIQLIDEYGYVITHFVIFIFVII